MVVRIDIATKITPAADVKNSMFYKSGGSKMEENCSA